MDQKQASQLLREADRIDGFRTAVILSTTNSAARTSTQSPYVAWNDQLAEQAKEQVKGRARIIIMSPATEAGMPHTRAPDLICLPAYWPAQFLDKTIRHELVHISQRKNPELWRKRLEDEGWSPAPKSAIPEEWLNRCRINPDTFSAGLWAWEGRHVPLPLFVREDKPSLRDIVVRWYDQKEGIVRQTAPTSFTRRYGTVTASEAEHPFELFAYRDTN